MKWGFPLFLLTTSLNAQHFHMLWKSYCNHLYKLQLQEETAENLDFIRMAWDCLESTTQQFWDQLLQ